MAVVGCSPAFAEDDDGEDDDEDDDGGYLMELEEARRTRDT